MELSKLETGAVWPFLICLADMQVHLEEHPVRPCHAHGHADFALLARSPGHLPERREHQQQPTLHAPAAHARPRVLLLCPGSQGPAGGTLRHGCLHQ